MGFISKLSWITNLVFAIGIVVAQVPEGLLPTIVVSIILHGYVVYLESGGFDSHCEETISEERVG